MVSCLLMQPGTSVSHDALRLLAARGARAAAILREDRTYLEQLIETARTTAMMFVILFGALAFSNFIEAAGLPTAWTLSKGSVSVRIAVVDTGVDVGHRLVRSARADPGRRELHERRPFRQHRHPQVDPVDRERPVAVVAQQLDRRR